MNQGPMSRSAYVVSFFARRSKDTPAFVIPTYDHVGEHVCAFLSLLFGKRFDNHGTFEHSGYFSLPDLSAFSEFCIPTLPQNSHSPRADFAIELNLEEARRLEPVLLGGAYNERSFQTFQGASKFYWRALQAAEMDAEVAYLHLVTSGEILANAQEFDSDVLMDSSIREALRSIKASLPNGAKLATMLSSRMRQIKRRFTATLCDLLDEPFFSTGEASLNFCRLARGDFAKRVAAAYDLRSKYVHTGISFGNWVTPRGGGNEEVHSGKPVVPDKEFARILAVSPTYVGLERIIRYALLRYAAREGLLNLSRVPTEAKGPS